MIFSAGIFKNYFVTHYSSGDSIDPEVYFLLAKSDLNTDGYYVVDNITYLVKNGICYFAKHDTKMDQNDVNEFINLLVTKILVWNDDGIIDINGCVGTLVQIFNARISSENTPIKNNTRVFNPENRSNRHLSSYSEIALNNYCHDHNIATRSDVSEQIATTYCIPWLIIIILMMTIMSSIILFVVYLMVFK